VETIGDKIEELLRNVGTAPERLKRLSRSRQAFSEAKPQVVLKD
jgi:hypothetical protein